MLSKRATYFLLACIILLGAWLRLYHINFESLWLEELQIINYSDPYHHPLTIIELSRSQGNESFYLLFYSIFKIFSHDAGVGRLTCAIMGILAIPVIYFLVKDLATPKAGLLGAFLIAINYWHIFYSQEFNVYSMAFLFSSLSYLFFIRAYKFAEERDFAAYIICTIILINTHSFAFIIFITQVTTLFLLVGFRKLERKVQISFLLATLTILIFAPWSVATFNNLLKGYSFMPHPKIYFILPYFHNYFGKDIVVTLIVTFLIFLFLVGLVKAYKRESNLNLLYVIVIIWLVLSYVIPFAISMFGNSILDIRYTIVSLPAWIALVSIGWERIQNFVWRAALIIVIGSSSLINIFFVKRYYSGIQKQQIREVSQLLKSKNEYAYPIYSSNAWEFNFYFKDTDQKVNRLDSLSNAKDLSKFWLLQAGNLKDEITELTKEFKLIEYHPLFEANALLLEKKVGN